MRKQLVQSSLLATLLIIAIFLPIVRFGVVGVAPSCWSLLGIDPDLNQIVASQASSINRIWGVYGVNWMAQTFYVTVDYTLTKIGLKMERKGWPASVMTVSLEGVGVNGKPTGSDLSTGTINPQTFPVASDFDDNSQQFNVTMSSYEMDVGVTYAIVVRSPSSTSDNTPRWRGCSIAYGPPAKGPYELGTPWHSSNSGSSWTNSYGEYENYDMAFWVYGLEIIPPSEANVTFTGWAIDYTYGDTPAEASVDVSVQLIRNNDSEPLVTQPVDLLLDGETLSGDTNSTGWLKKTFTRDYYLHQYATVYAYYAGTEIPDEIGNCYDEINMSHTFAVVDARAPVYSNFFRSGVDSRNSTYANYTAWVHIYTNDLVDGLNGYYVVVSAFGYQQFAGLTSGEGVEAGMLNGYVAIPITSDPYDITVTITGYPPGALYDQYRSLVSTQYNLGSEQVVEYIPPLYNDPRIPVTIDYVGDESVWINQYPHIVVKLYDTVAESYFTSNVNCSVKVQIGYVSYHMAWNDSAKTWNYNSWKGVGTGDRLLTFTFNGSYKYQNSSLEKIITIEDKHVITLIYTGDASVDQGDYPHFNVKVYDNYTDSYLDSDLGAVAIRIRGTNYACEWNDTSKEWCFNSYLTTASDPPYVTAYFAFSGTSELKDASKQQRVTVTATELPPVLVTLYVHLLNGTEALEAIDVYIYSGDTLLDTQATNSTGYAEFDDVEVQLTTITATYHSIVKATAVTPYDNEVVTFQYGSGISFDLEAVFPLIGVVVVVSVMGTLFASFKSL